MAMTIPKCAIKGCECNAAINEYYPNSEGGQYWTLCEKCYEEDQEEESDEVVQYELTWLNGDSAEIYDTLEEAKAVVDKYRESHELDYGLIRSVVDGELVGEWGEFSDDWEAKIEFDTDKMDQALNDDGLDWTLDEPTDDTKYVCVYVIKK